MCRRGNRLRRSDRRNRCSSAKASTCITSRPSIPARESCTRADSIPSLRISLSSRCTGRRGAGRRRAARRHQLRGADASGGAVRRHGRVDDRSDARGVQLIRRSRRLLEDPVHPDAGPRAEPELGAQPDYPWRRGGDIAPELDGYWIGRLHDGRRRIPELSGAATHYWTDAYGRAAFAIRSDRWRGSSVVAPVAVGGRCAAASTAVTALGSRYLDKVPEQLVERILPKAGHRAE